ncbi:MAG: single-stranded DNA-binding protein [bacterium]|nr:single-stranded DNA-binding protein [bacterium]
MLNETRLIGNLTKDAEFATNGDGQKRAALSLATNTYWYSEGERKQRTDYHRVVAFGPQAERARALHKGARLFVAGRLQTRKFVQDDQTRYITEVVADRVEPLGT